MTAGPPAGRFDPPEPPPPGAPGDAGPSTERRVPAGPPSPDGAAPPAASGPPPRDDAASLDERRAAVRPPARDDAAPRAERPAAVRPPARDDAARPDERPAAVRPPASDGAPSAVGRPAAGGAEAAPAAPATASYGGLATRVLAFAADAVVINVVGWFVALVVSLGLSLLDIPSEVEDTIVGIGAFIGGCWTVAYFVFFWSTTGQTPGNRLMRIRVQDRSGSRPIRPRRALLRFFGLILSAIPLCAGYLLILVDNRRRALHDRLARTVVVDVADEADPVRSDVGRRRRADRR